jgi:hypothetical protein
MELRTDPEAMAETTLPDACVSCGGDVHIRVMRGRATSVCNACHWIGHPNVQVDHDGLKVSFEAAAKA